MNDFSIVIRICIYSSGKALLFRQKNIFLKRFLKMSHFEEVIKQIFFFQKNVQQIQENSLKSDLRASFSVFI